MKTVVKPIDEDDTFNVSNEAFTDAGIIFNSKIFDGLKAPGESVIKAIQILEDKKIGKKKKLILDSKIGEFHDRGIGDVLYLSLMMKIIIL